MQGPALKAVLMAQDAAQKELQLPAGQRGHDIVREPPGGPRKDCREEGLLH